MYVNMRAKVLQIIKDLRIKHPAQHRCDDGPNDVVLLEVASNMLTYSVCLFRAASIARVQVSHFMLGR